MRRATGRDDIWGVGLTMSGEATDTENEFFQFMAAYDAHYVTPDGRLVIDDPRSGAGSSRRSTATPPFTARAAPRPTR